MSNNRSVVVVPAANSVCSSERIDAYIMPTRLAPYICDTPVVYFSDPVNTFRADDLILLANSQYFRRVLVVFGTFLS